jgi:molybdate transport system permease protein
MRASPRWIWALALLPLLLFGLPLLALSLEAKSSGELGAALTSPLVLDALRVSLLTTTLALFLTVLFGTPLAWILARKPFPGRSLVNTLVDLPLVLPPAVAGVALLMAFGRNGLWGGLFSENGLAFSATAVVLAQIFVAAPFYIRSATTGFRAVPFQLEEVALSLGASRSRVFREITLPLARPALISGAVMCWTRALGEFGATIMFAGSLPGETQTMPLAIYAAMESNWAEALALSMLLILTSVLVLLAIRRVKHAA